LEGGKDALDFGAAAGCELKPEKKKKRGVDGGKEMHITRRPVRGT
jgi:hypothetical protein